MQVAAARLRSASGTPAKEQAKGQIEARMAQIEARRAPKMLARNAALGRGSAVAAKETPAVEAETSLEAVRRARREERRAAKLAAMALERG
jgi:hypothetical protein